jgi:hypothetical protein
MLREDPDRFADAIGTVGATPRVSLRNKTTPGAILVLGAMQAGTPLDVSTEEIQLLPLERGVNVLLLNVEGPSASDHVQLVEHCDAGEAVIREVPMGATTFGAEPVLRFEINGR